MAVVTLFAKEVLMRRLPSAFPLVLFLLASFPALYGKAQQPKSAPPVAASTHDEIAAADRIEAKDLAASLQKSASPLILQVGPRSMFDQAHILGSEYAGAADSEAGLVLLRERVQSVSRDRWVVVYCGCCPWDRCPNIRPAFRKLRTMGFTHVQALYLPTNFGQDWVDKGYPTEK